MRGTLDRLRGLVLLSAGEGGGAPAPQASGEGAAVVVPDTQAAIAAALGGQQAAAGAGEQGGATPPAAGAITGEQLAALRAEAVKLNPNVVPELITGGTVEEVIASLGPAREAFQRAVNQAQASEAGALPAGGGTREVDRSAYEGLSPEGKIQFALNNPRS